jgi:hypothetical protein
VLIGNAGTYSTCYSGRSAFNGFQVPTVTVNDGAVSQWRQRWIFTGS